jgi:predicted DNA binding CopG/RHH family protein
MTMKKKGLVIPRFEAESDDARWHDRHKRQLEAAMEKRLKEGSTLTGRQAAARAKLRPVTIRLPTQDIDAARELAAEKGIGYQTYIKILLREALRRENSMR